MRKISSEDLRKSDELEREGAVILSVYKDKVRHRHIKNIAYRIGLMVNRYALLTYTLVGIFNVILVELNTNLAIVYSLLLTTLFLLDKCHKFYLKETVRVREPKITIARNRFSKLK